MTTPHDNMYESENREPVGVDVQRQREREADDHYRLTGLIVHMAGAHQAEKVDSGRSDLSDRLCMFAATWEQPSLGDLLVYTWPQVYETTGRWTDGTPTYIEAHADLNVLSPTEDFLQRLAGQPGEVMHGLEAEQQAELQREGQIVFRINNPGVADPANQVSVFAETVIGDERQYLGSIGYDSLQQVLSQNQGE